MAVTFHADGVHVIDQSGQGYGSERRSCNRCGQMASPGMRYFESYADWQQQPESVRCTRYIR